MGTRLQWLLLGLLLVGPLMAGPHPPAGWEEPCPYSGLEAPAPRADLPRVAPWPRPELRPARAEPDSVSAETLPRWIEPGRFELATNEFVRLVVDQERGDLKVVVREPGGAVVLEVDSLSGPGLAEEVVILATRPGWYRIEGVAWDRLVGDGPVPARELDRRPALPADRDAWRAAVLTWEGKKAASPERRLEAWRQARELYSALGDEAGVAEVSFRLGDLLESLSRFREACAEFQRSVAAGRHLRDHQKYLMALQSYGALLKQVGDLKALRAVGEEGLRVSTLSRESAWRARFLVLVALSKVDEGEPEEAIRPLEEAFAIWEKTAEGGGKVEVLNALGRAYFKLGYPERALDFHRQALELLGRGDDPELIAATLHLLGAAAATLGDGGRAFFSLQWAAKIWRGLGNRSEEATVSTSLARVALLDGDLASALRALEEAAAIYEELSDPVNGAQTKANAAWILTGLRQPERALEMAARAEAEAGREPRASLVAFLHLVRATALGQASRFEEAVREARSGLRMVEDRRRRIGQADLRQGFAPGVQSYYEVAIESLMASHARQPGQGWNREALEVSERARARSLLDGLEGEAAEPDVSVATIQSELLDADTALLELFAGSKKSYLWAVTRDGFHSYDLPARDRLQALARKVTADIAKSDRTDDLRALRRWAKALSRQLFGPMGRLPDRKRLVLVVPPELQAVPFVALPDPFAPAGEGGAGSWPAPLIVERVVVVEPSMAVLAALRRRQSESAPAGREVAAFAAPRYSAREAGVGGPIPLSCLDGSVRLPATKVWPLRFGLEEVRLIEAETAGNLRAFVGAEASAARVRSLDLTPFRYLYFSAHGRADEGDANRSALVLSALDGRGGAVEPCLFAHDIAKLAVSAELVMLSACRSGLGRSIAGEGVLGLSQAFLTAGASRVGVTLWDVQERPSSALMADFHRRYLGMGVEPVEALRSAQLEAWKTPGRSAPAHWAGFQLLGEWK